MLDISTTSIDQIIALVPELGSLRKVEETNIWHDHDNEFDHTVAVFGRVKEIVVDPPCDQSDDKTAIQTYLSSPVGLMKRSDILLWTAILHDIGKPGLFRMTPYGMLAPGHEEHSFTIAQSILPRVGIDTQSSDRILKLIRYHGWGHEVIGLPSLTTLEESIRAINDYLRGPTGSITLDLLLFAYADMAGSQLSRLNAEQFAKRSDRYKALYSHVISTLL